MRIRTDCLFDPKRVENSIAGNSVVFQDVVKATNERFGFRIHLEHDNISHFVHVSWEEGGRMDSLLVTSVDHDTYLVSPMNFIFK